MSTPPTGPPVMTPTVLGVADCHATIPIRATVRLTHLPFEGSAVALPEPVLELCGHCFGKHEVQLTIDGWTVEERQWPLT